ncbi:MAG: thiamine pyrophosphate-binding protein [Bacteroidetes bacterium]|nr:thiamine pyrophosphate-binding protein [Bacteroidota bacterium]
MRNYYTAERNIQIVISLLKAHGVRRIVASPGATDVSIVASLQHDKYFELYSSIDERSAAYIACGIAAESGEPVAIICTGATSSRNYMPGLTEAYYRHLPILAITCCRSNVNVGHYVDQVTDRSNLPNDIANESVYVQTIHCPDDEWDCMIKVNKAILALTRNGGGPSHINLATVYSRDFSVKEIAPVRKIQRYCLEDCLPEIHAAKVGIFVGAHVKWSHELTEVVDRFCSIYNAAVFCDQTSNYKGKYRILFPLITEQFGFTNGEPEIDLLIHIGYVSSSVFKGKVIWRVNKDGEIRDTFRRMHNVFQMSELDFFKYYVNQNQKKENTLYSEYLERYNSLLQRLPDIPFSNLWIAKQLAARLPDNSVLHLGIRNSLRSWNYFEIPNSVLSYCNTGGFGIDGGISSLIGSSFIDRNKLYYGVFGDLLFYYDMNSLGNRDIARNVRILIVNNGLGQEFKNYSCFSSMFGEDTDKFIAARGHFGNSTKKIIKDYAEDLGFEYLTASNEEEFNQVYETFINPSITDKPMLFEAFTTTENESEAYKQITTISTRSKLMKRADDVISMPQLSAVRNVIKKYIKR